MKKITALSRYYTPTALILAGMLLNGCVATAIVGGTAAAGSAAFDERSVGEHMDDVAIAAKIKTRMIAEKDFPSRWISVEVLRGDVTLTGYLPHQNQIDRAIIICRSFKGVKTVHSQVKLGKPSTNSLISDSWITTRVKSRLLDDPITSGFSVHVETVDGVVYLQGFVKDDEQRYRAKNLALSVSGVAAVDNQLRIEP